MKMQKIATRLEIKASDSKTGEIEGFGTIFGIEDSVGDVVQKGAFLESINSGRAVKMLYQHNVSEVLGVWDEVEETESGLRVKGRIAADTSLGSDVLTLLKMGAIDGLSIGFNTPKGGAHWGDDGVRTLSKVDLWEVSVVTFPALLSAQIETVKSLKAIDELDLSGLDRSLREAGFSRDGAKRLLHRHSHLVSQREAEKKSADELVEAVAGLRAAFS